MFSQFYNLIFGMFLMFNATTNADNSHNFKSAMRQIYSSGYFNSQSNNSMFSTGKSSPYIINSINSTETTMCHNFCESNEYCRGVFEYLDTNNNTICNSLNNIGTELNIESDLSSISYKKHLSFSNISNINNIHVRLMNYEFLHDYEFNNTINYNSTIYLDINNNGQLDLDEYSITKEMNSLISDQYLFENLTLPFYHIRQIIHDNKCDQIYPGVEGSVFYSISKNQYFYVTKITEWSSSIHSHGIKGGTIDNKNITTNLNFIIGDNDNTYLSFCPEESITLQFDGAVIHNIESEDITFNLIDINQDRIKSTYAEVYLSADNINWDYVGHISYNKSNIELSNYNHDYSNYVKLSFKGPDHSSFLNLSSVSIKPYLHYYEPFSYSIPANNPYLQIFINDCSNIRNCGDYCILNIFDSDERLSCKKGCREFDEVKYCGCLDNTKAGYKHSREHCFMGCAYEADAYFNDNYIVLPLQSGSKDNILELNINNFTSREDYLQQVNLICKNTIECRGFTISSNHSTLFKNVFNRNLSSNELFLVKPGPLVSPTSTATSSPTTSLITSPTSTATTSPTSTATSSPTTSLITSPTSTASSSPTSTASSSPTTSLITSPTSTTTNILSFKSTTLVPNQTIEKSKDKNEGLTVEYIILISVIASLIILLFIFAWVIRSRNTQPIIQNDRTVTSFNNPVYDSTIHKEQPLYSNFIDSSDSGTNDEYSNEYKNGNDNNDQYLELE